MDCVYLCIPHLADCWWNFFAVNRDCEKKKSFKINRKKEKNSDLKWVDSDRLRWAMDSIPQRIIADYCNSIKMLGLTNRRESIS